MKITKAQLKRLIKEELEEARTPDSWADAPKQRALKQIDAIHDVLRDSQPRKVDGEWAGITLSAEQREFVLARVARIHNYLLDMEYLSDEEAGDYS